MLGLLLKLMKLRLKLNRKIIRNESGILFYGAFVLPFERSFVVEVKLNYGQLPARRRSKLVKNAFEGGEEDEGGRSQPFFLVLRAQNK